MINTAFPIHSKKAPFGIRLLAGLMTLLLSHAALAAPQDSTGSVDDLYAQGLREMSSSWRGVTKSHDEALFMHTDRRRESDGRIAVWMHRELASSGYFEKEKPYLSLRERLLVDCKASRLGITDVAYYGERFAKGAIAGTTKSKSPEMMDPVPDSIEDQVLHTICAPKARQTPQRQKKMP